MKSHIILLAVTAMLLAGAMLSPVFAQGVTLDAKKPIEITADSLEVMQKEQQAEFIGNVVAIQGKMRITANRMKVFYRTGDQQKGDAQAISSIEVIGNVFMTNTSETARSKSGVYNVDDNKLILKNDVVLTRGENVVKGEVLEYDLITGKSQIVGAGVTTKSPDGNQQGGKKGRVRGLFVPGNTNE
ncbi:MAG: lipopolysaccharide transport periplasmic protein LptA [Alphaproteobacteria bacterium]|nr:lipopolysaccharide transport periplasmic protein LptA [Alphaproteobacteria bacterium]